MDKYLKLAKQKFNQSKKNWFERTDLDQYLYGSTGDDHFVNHSDSDEPYLYLFPQDLLDAIEQCIHCEADMQRINASNVLKGLKESGYKIVKI